MRYDGDTFPAGRFWPAALIALAAFLAFGLTLRGGFMWDDHRMIEQNPRLAVTAANVAHAFASDPFNQELNYYRPLQTLSNMADFAVWGLRPFGYHFTSLAFHAAGAALFFYLALALGFPRPAAFWSAVLLAVHPAAVEQLLIIAGRAELASGACTLAAILLFLERRHALSFLFFIAACGFKENGVITPALTALCLWYLRRERADYLKLLPFFIFIPLYLFLRHAALGQGAYERGLAPLLYGLCLKVPQAIFVYLKTAALPFDLHSHRMQPGAGLYSWAALAGAAAAAALIWRRGGRVGVFLLLWYVLNLAPKTPLLATNDLMLDHWVYLANAALFLGAAAAAQRLTRPGARFLLPLAAAAIFAVSSAATTLIRDTDLKNYEYSARSSVSKPMLYNLAREYFLMGRATESRALLEKISAADPANALYLNGLALARWRTGDIPGALAAIDAALAKKPGDAETLFNKYSILAGTGRAKDAAAAQQQLLTLHPDHIPTLLIAARSAAAAGRAAEAAVFFERALGANPYDAQALNDSGILLARAGKYSEAGLLFKRALKVSPGLDSARQNLARLEKLKTK
ncbi:MAG TPA: tetratricopeptide repeat protein [Elusimicrobiales bacterium]|nr:tetratricopeptide repeat protein [Elusimicrobiales bacterium]